MSETGRKSTSSIPTTREQPSASSADRSVLQRRVYGALGTAVLSAAVLAVHGWSLWDGTVLDDHWHQRGLRENGWSLSELLRTLVIEPAQWMHFWWQDEPVRWEYGRPAFIAAMKLVYHVLGGDDPAYLHAFSILLHFASVLMVWRLCWMLTADRLWSLVGGALFAIYPNAVVTVAWSSSQNCVIQTALMLAALLLYARAAGLRRCLALENTAPGDALRAGNEHLRPVSFLAALLLWTIALFTKENAIILPAILLALEWLEGGRARVWRRRWTFLAFAAVGVAFSVWRFAAVTQPMPDVYVRRPNGDWLEYGAWASAKLLHYLTTSIWLAPMMIGPTGRFNPWREVPGDCLLMLGIVAALAVGYWLAARRWRGWWLWPGWIVLSVLPVVPVVATPHSGYMCGVGFSAAAALATARRGGERGGAGLRFARGFVLIVFVGGTSVLSMFSRWQWTGTIAAERYFTTWLVADAPAPATRDLFFINLPFVNIYAKPALDVMLGPGFRDVRAHVLTFAPDPFVIEQRVTVEALDSHRLAVSIESPGFFSRLLGRFLVAGFRRDHRRFQAGQSFRSEHFDVEIERVDGEGVGRLVFTFPHPLSDPSYCFYLSTADCSAARLRFPVTGSDTRARLAPPFDADAISAAARQLESGDAAAGELLLAAAGASEGDTSAAAQASIRPAARWMAGALGAPVQPLLDRSELSRDEWERVRVWWRGGVDDANLRAVWIRRGEFAHFVEEREEVPHSRMWAAKVIRTDLYLTGPPFPGPR